MSEAPIAQAADAGPLSIDAAIEALSPKEAAAPTEAAAPEEPEEPIAQSTGEEADEAPEAVEGEEAETPEPEAPVVDAPHWWTAEQKALWSEVPAHIQAVVAEQESNRERATSKAKQEAAEARNRSEAEAKGMGDIKSRLEAILPQAAAAFASKWPEQIDWVATAQEHGVEQTQLWKLQYEQEQQTLQRMTAAREEAEAREFQNFVQTEFARLPEVEPELVDPARRQSVVSFLLERGLPPEQIRNAGALELSLAYDAMRFRQNQAKAKASLVAPVKKPVAARPTVAPGAAQSQSPTERTAQQVRNRFAQTRSVDDAVALLLAKG
jgi:hypothetical protein